MAQKRKRHSERDRRLRRANSVTRFDDSLPRLVHVVAKIFGREILDNAAVLRDAGGRLSVVLPNKVGQRLVAAADTEIRSALGGYARPENVVSDEERPGARQLLEAASEVVPTLVGEFRVRVIDRRIVGADWLRLPAKSTTGIPRIVFSSLKGGVGRSTALCVLAAHLSRRGRRVLTIDFDLEAPGIGTMLLSEQELPRFGTIDYLVENGISGIDSDFMANLGGDSILGADGARVTVVPAIGRATADNPRNVLGKISRAYLEDINADGSVVPLSEQLREMVARFEKTGAYDIVLVDIRAGLHETTAAAMLALGGEVLLFGLDQPQTFLGYRLLMSHLATFPHDPADDWRERMRFVHAKAPESAERRSAGDDRFLALYEIVAPPSLPEASGVGERLTAKDFDIEWIEKGREFEVDLADVDTFEVPPIIHIFDDARYRDFDPVSDITLLSPRSYFTTFQELLEYADMTLDIDDL